MKVPRALAVIVLSWLAAATLSAAGGGWLDAPPAGWNKPGAAVPQAPSVEGNPDPHCRDQAHPAASAGDRAVAAAGWTLVGPLQIFGDTAVVTGASAFDGMCRWWGYQVFVFVDGRFAGTLSPGPMNSRTDGAVVQVHVYQASIMTAEFVRYAEKDPLCCPSGKSLVSYRVEQGSGGLVIVPLEVSTTPSNAP